MLDHQSGWNRQKGEIEKKIAPLMDGPVKSRRKQHSNSVVSSLLLSSKNKMGNSDYENSFMNDRFLK